MGNVSSLLAARHYVDDHGALDRTQRHLPCEELSVARPAVVVVREAVAAIQGAAACAYFVPQFLALLFGSIFEKVGTVLT